MNPLNCPPNSASASGRPRETAREASVNALLRRLLYAFCAASRRIVDLQSVDLKEHANANIRCIYEKLSRIEASIGHISHQVDRQDERLVDALSKRNVVAEAEVHFKNLSVPSEPPGRVIKSTKKRIPSRSQPRQRKNPPRTCKKRGKYKQ